MVETLDIFRRECYDLQQRNDSDHNPIKAALATDSIPDIYHKKHDLQQQISSVEQQLYHINGK